MAFELTDPRPLRCQGCGATWWSRLASHLTSTPDLGRCVKCGGVLVLQDQQPAQG
jgi:hypothetical protein